MRRYNRLTLYLGGVSTRRSPLVHPEMKNGMALEKNASTDHLLIEEFLQEEQQ